MVEYGNSFLCGCDGLGRTKLVFHLNSIIFKAMLCEDDFSVGFER